MSNGQPVVLIIDDELQIRRFLRAGFELEHFTVVDAESGEAGLRAATLRPVDLILVDLGLPDLDGAIDEMLRVLKPGGQALSLDFDRPSSRAVLAAYLLYLNIVGAALGWLLHRDPDTYRYIPASIRRYPGAAAVSRMMERRGFERVRNHAVLGGLMAIHHARKPCA